MHVCLRACSSLGLTRVWGTSIQWKCDCGTEYNCTSMCARLISRGMPSRRFSVRSDIIICQSHVVFAFEFMFLLQLQPAQSHWSHPRVSPAILKAGIVISLQGLGSISIELLRRYSELLGSLYLDSRTFGFSTVVWIAMASTMALC